MTFELRIFWLNNILCLKHVFFLFLSFVFFFFFLFCFPDALEKVSDSVGHIYLTKTKTKRNHFLIPR